MVVTFKNVKLYGFCLKRPLTSWYIPYEGVTIFRSCNDNDLLQ